MRSLWRVLLIATTTVALCTSCAHKQARDVASLSGSAAPSGSQPVAAPDDQDQFTRCMKDHGSAPQQVEISGDSGTASQAPVSPNERRKQQQAQEACRQFLPNGGNPQAMNPEQLERARAVAKCMRAAGVDYPDPDPNRGAGSADGGGSMAIPDGVDLKNPAIAAKLARCSRGAGASGAGPAGGGQ